MENFPYSEQSKRFIQMLDELINKRIIDSDVEFCRIVGYAPQSLSQIRKEKRNVTIELLENTEKAFKVDVAYIITGQKTITPDVREDVRPHVRVGKKSQIQTYKSDEPEQQMRTLLHTVDNTGKENILLIPIKAQAGYLLGSSEPEYVEKLPTFWLPGINHGTYRAFEVAGYSMLVDHGVGFSPGDIVIGQYVENPQDIKDGRIYILVNNAQDADDIVLKRCLNRLEKEGGGKVWCKSDNRDYPMFPLEQDQIKEVWEFKRKITAQAPDPVSIYERLNDLDTRVGEIELERKRLTK